MRSVLVTVDAPHESLDLELPAEVPLRELLPILLELCRLPVTPPGPSGAAASSVWALGVAGLGPLPSSRSLAESEIVDGARLLLQDSLTWRQPRPSDTSAGVRTGAPRRSASGIGVRWRRDGLLSGS